jgi:hypothetical protein
LTISLWIRPRTCTHYIANDSCACEYYLKHTSSSMGALQREVNLIGERIEQCQIDIMECL